MTCTQCGSIILDGNQFCSSCGTKAQSQQIRPSETFCGSCGYQVTGQHFCPKCGTQVTGQPQTVTHSQPVQQVAQRVQPVAQPIQQSVGANAYRTPEDYLNLKMMRTWAAVLIFLSPLFGIWGYLLVNKIPKTTTEFDARKYYRKAKTLCIIGSIFAVFSIMIYSGM